MNPSSVSVVSNLISRVSPHAMEIIVNSKPLLSAFFQLSAFCFLFLPLPLHLPLLRYHDIANMLCGVALIDLLRWKELL